MFITLSSFSQQNLVVPYLKKCAKVDSVKREECTQELVFEMVKYRIDQQMKSLLYDFAQNVDISFFINSKGRVSQVEINTDIKPELKNAIEEAFLLLPKFIVNNQLIDSKQLFEFKTSIYFTYK